jgi:replicative DNA helicase
MSNPLPASRDSEIAVLGAILLDNQAYWQASAEIEPADFTLDSHRRIYCRMVELAEAGKPIDYVTLTDQLGQHKEIETVGGVAYVTSLTDGLPRVKNIEQYVNILKDKSRRRMLINACTAGSAAAADEGTPTRVSMEMVQDALLELEANSKKIQTRPLIEFSDETFIELEELRNSEAEVVGFSTGIPSMDEGTTGIRSGELWVVGGRPGDGKTSLALQIAGANAPYGARVGMFSIEMAKSEVLHRLWVKQSKIAAQKLRQPRFMSGEEWSKVRQAMSEVGTWPLYIDDSSALSISELAARSRLMIRRHGVGLILVDYLQIVDAPGKDERQRLTAISRALRMLAKEERVGIVALSQMARPSDKSMNRRPTKFDLKESGSLEADAHTVVLIFRPVDEFNQYNGEDELIIDKQRHGPRGIQPVFYNERLLRFEERFREGSQ